MEYLEQQKPKFLNFRKIGQNLAINLEKIKFLIKKINCKLI